MPIPSPLKLLISLLLALPGLLGAATYYVSPSGSDGDPGTFEEPFQTIQRAANVANDGDIVEIRAGTYREKVVPANSGSNGNPIIFRAYQNEEVTLSGLEDVTTLTGNSWQHEGGNIYYLDGISEWNSSELGQSDMVFAGGERMHNSPYPNNPDDTFTPIPYAISDSQTIVSGNKNSSQVVVRFNGSDFNSGGGNFYVGAHAVFSLPPYWYYKSGTVTASGNGWIEITYAPQYEDAWPGWHSWFNDFADNRKQVYLMGFRNGLDAEGEFYLDESANRLYLWAPGGVDPDTLTVEVKRRDWGFDLTDRHHIEIRDLKLWACSLTTDNLIRVDDGGEANDFRSDNIGYPHGPLAPAHHITLHGLIAEHYFHSENLSLSSYYQWQTSSGMILSGSNITLEDSILSHASQNGVTFIGERNTINNCYITTTSYYPHETAAINMGHDGTRSEDMLITNNTLEYSGRSLIICRGVSSTTVNRSRFSNNILRHAMLLTDDGGAIYTFNTNTGDGLEITENIIHDHNGSHDMIKGHGAMGVYMDSPHNNYNFTIHHNLIYNVRSGIATNGTHALTRIYNNTMHNTVMGGVGSGQNKNRWGIDIVHNIFSGTYELGREEVWLLGWNVTTYQNILSSTDPLFNNLAQGDFTIPNHSPAASANSVTTNTGLTNNPGYQGAFEPGEPAWTAGSTLDPDVLGGGGNASPSITLLTPTISELGVPGIEHALLVRGSASDDGLPESSSLSYNWTQVSGPGTATFSSATSVDTDVTFSAEGEYELRLDVSDSQKGASQLLTVTVGDPSSAPSGPLAGSGVRKQFYVNRSYNTIWDFVNDSGYPENHDWEEVITDGLDHPAFGQDGYAVRFSGFFIAPQSGSYTFQILGDDRGEFHLSTDETPANLALVCSTGPTSYTNWNQAGTGDVTLTAGQAYYFEALLVEKTLADHLRVGVIFPDATTSQPIANQYLALPDSNGAPTLNFGPQITPTTASTADTDTAFDLTATVSDDNLPASATLTHQWSHVSGPATPAISNDTSLNASLTFATAGTYLLRLSSSDGEVTTARDLSIEASGALSGWPAFASLHSLDETQPGEDSDGDGLSDFLEYALGGQPMSADYGTYNPSLQPNGSNLEISFVRASADATYYVEEATDPTTASWTTIATNPGSVGNPVTVSAPMSGRPKVFLRVRVVE